MQIHYDGQTYIVEEQFSSGGFGLIFKAQRVTPFPFGHYIVIKSPAPTVTADPDLMARFEREARIFANINHTNVARMIAYWVFPDGTRAIAQEMVRGALSADKYIAANPNDAPSVLVQSLYALRAIHESGGFFGTPGAVHRDISPRNILVDAAGCVKVIDFGLSKRLPNDSIVLTGFGGWIGTPGCMSPEQMGDAANADRRSDLYALGRTLGASIQGRNPQYLDMALLPEPWKSVCGKLAAHDPAYRYQTADEALEDALDRFSTAGIRLTQFDIHAQERVGRSVTAAWQKTVAIYLGGLTDVTEYDLRAAAKLHATAFAALNASVFFDVLEKSTAVGAFNTGSVSYEMCDSLGDLYQSLYPLLDATRKLTCFTRLVRTAVKWHRFHVMANVRMTWDLEPDPAIHAHLKAIIQVEDTASVIHSNGRW
jgi:serine/threonine protein kinase